MPFVILAPGTHDCTCMIMLHLMIFSHTITNVSLGLYIDSIFEPRGPTVLATPKWP